MDEKVITTISSYVFLVNSFIALNCCDSIYSILFFTLFCTSILMRTVECDLTYLLDKCFVYAVVLYGGYIFYLKYPTINTLLCLLIVSTFLITIFLYHWGYETKQYCFDKNTFLSQLYHAMLHVVSFIGHALIIIS
jgi:hypothetical protein